MSSPDSATRANSTGFSYSAELADRFGLPASDATPFEAPLLGVAMDIRTGIRGGKICSVHVLFGSDTPVRLPDAPRMTSISANIQELPFAFLGKPGGDIRKEVSSRVRAMSNRAIIRFGRSELTGPATAGHDADGSYTSMPLEAYDREFVPGVAWLVMPVNCALAADNEYDYASLFVESSTSPSDMILNQQVDPGKMIEFKIPGSFLAGMKPSLNAALASDDDVTTRIDPPMRYTVITPR